MFDLDPISTTDLVTIIGTITTAFFSYLLLKATRASNKIAKAIEKSNNIEKENINNQNRHMVIQSLEEIKLELNKHNERTSIAGEGKRNIMKMVDDINESNLPLFFNTKEIRSIKNFSRFMKDDFNKKILKSGAYSSPFNTEEGRIAYMKEKMESNKKELPTIRKAKQEVASLIKTLK